MTTDPVRVLGIHEDAVTTSHTGDHITAIVLRLSGEPSDEWVSAFALEWGRTEYPRKRSVHVGSVRVHNEAAVRQGLVVHASPEDYVVLHRPHVERAVERANALAGHRDGRQDETVARANRAIRAINAEAYGAGAKAAYEPPAVQEPPALGTRRNGRVPAGRAAR